jgi:hypothetical protein
VIPLETATIKENAMIQIESAIGEMPSILVKLLHHGFTFKVIPQFKPEKDDPKHSEITEISTIEISGNSFQEVTKETVKSCLGDQVPDWAKFIKDRKPEFVIA